MKKLMLIAAVALFVSAATSKAQITLDGGGSYDYSFSILPGPFSALGPLFDNRGAIILGVDTSTIDAGDTVRFEFFEEGIIGPADSVFTFDLSSGQAVISAADGLWADRDGSFRLTAVSGSFKIDTIGVIRGEPNLFPGQPVSSGLYQFDFTPIPEPSKVTFGLLTGAFLLLSRRYRS